MILLSSNGAGSILLLVGYIAIFAAIMYFAAIRPQKKQQKKQQLTYKNHYGSITTVAGERHKIKEFWRGTEVVITGRS